MNKIKGGLVSFLKKLIINYERVENQGFKLFQQISIYLNLLIHLELPKIFTKELINILESCKKLKYLCIILSDDGLSEENLKILGKFIPKFLKRIQLREINFLKLSSKSLKYFLEECIINGDSVLKYLEFNGCESIGQEYIDVTKQFGVQLIKI